MVIILLLLLIINNNNRFKVLFSYDDRIYDSSASILPIQYAVLGNKYIFTFHNNINIVYFTIVLGILF